MTFDSRWPTSEQRMLRAGASIEARGKPVIVPLKEGVNCLSPAEMSPMRDRRCPRRETEVTCLPVRPTVAYTFARMRYPLPRPGRVSRRTCSTLGLVAVSAVIAASFACSSKTAADMTASEKNAVADTLKRLVVSAYDLSAKDPVKNLVSLYPSGGRVISASGGAMTTTHPQLEQGIKTFWAYVGQHMVRPRWEWTSMNVDVLAPDAAVMTSTYRIPHRTPKGLDHIIGGAWTAVFQKQEDRWVIIQEHLSDYETTPSLPAKP